MESVVANLFSADISDSLLLAFSMVVVAGAEWEAM